MNWKPGKVTSFALNKMVVDAVQRELVSAINSLLCGKIQGNSRFRAGLCISCREKKPILLANSRKFPNLVAGNYFRIAGKYLTLAETVESRQITVGI